MGSQAPNGQTGQNSYPLTCSHSAINTIVEFPLPTHRSCELSISSDHTKYTRNNPWLCAGHGKSRDNTTPLKSLTSPVTIGLGLVAILDGSPRFSGFFLAHSEEKRSLISLCSVSLLTTTDHQHLGMPKRLVLSQRMEP
ncbi:unnamed protein product [Choristocarpus tenellus]